MTDITSGLIIRHPVNSINWYLELFSFLDPYTKFQPICEVDPFPVWAIIVIVVFVLIVILAALTGWFSIFNPYKSL